jgi:hypothetical protein
MNNYSIKDFRERLDQWREETLDHRKQVIPEFMMEELLELITISSRSYVAKRLTIDSVLLAQRIKSFEQQNEDSMEFVEISPHTSQEAEHRQPLLAGRVEYISSSGTIINFHLPDLNASTISSILKDRAS